VVNPQKSLDYVHRTRNKKVVYRTFITNTYNNIGVGSSLNALINSSIVHPTGVLLVPFIASVQNLGFGHSQLKSPFDTYPATTSPLSLYNLLVAVDGQNVLQSTLQHNYELF
jgi:hypothetical protein